MIRMAKFSKLFPGIELRLSENALKPFRAFPHRIAAALATHPRSWSDVRTAINLLNNIAPEKTCPVPQD